MVITTEFPPLSALIFVGVVFVRALAHFIIGGVVESFYQGVGIWTIQVVWTLVPTAIVENVVTLVLIVLENVRRSPEILLSVSIVAITPLMLLVNQGTEGSLVAIDHEFFEGQDSLEFIQIDLESPIIDELPHVRALFGVKWQRINFLLFLVEWLNFVQQTLRRK